MEAQLAIGTTLDRRILTGLSAAQAAPGPSKALARAATSAAASPVCARRMISSRIAARKQLGGICPAKAHRRQDGCGCGKRSPAGDALCPLPFSTIEKSLAPSRDFLAFLPLPPLLMPRQQPPPQPGHGGDQRVADNCNLDDAGEHAARVGEAGGLHHGAAEAVAEIGRA